MTPPIPEDKLAQIKGALRQGGKIEAIKLYRKYTAEGLAEAKAAVENLEVQLRAEASSPVNPDDNLAGVKEALFRGQKIEAIKQYRKGIDVGLAEAKTSVEQLEAQLRVNSPDKFSAPPSREGCLGTVTIICVVVAAIYLWLAKG